MSLALVEKYLREIHAVASTSEASAEMSYYPALSGLLSGIGESMDPRVTFVAHPKGMDDARPDGGLFSEMQLAGTAALSADAVLASRRPDHGVVEVKGVREELDDLAGSRQVRRYWEKYHQVLITNYREFALVASDQTGALAVLERFRLADTELDLWQAAAHPRQRAQERGEELVGYLRRVMLRSAPITMPEDVAAALAVYARRARERLETRATAADITGLRDVLGAALGLQFDGEQGARFFRSTLIQTLFYGVFSSWVLWSRQQDPADHTAHFRWQMAAWSLRVPMVRALFDQLAMPVRLHPLGILDILDWTQDVLNRVDRRAFFSRFDDEAAVQYF